MNAESRALCVFLSDDERDTRRADVASTMPKGGAPDEPV